MPAPVASGWSGRRAGLAPAGNAPPCHGARGERTSTRLVQYLLDHLVGGCEERWREGDADCSGSRKVKDRQKLGWVLHWQIGGVSAFQDAIKIIGRTAHQIAVIDAVRHQSPVHDEEAVPISRGKPISGCQADDGIAVYVGKAVWQNEYPAVLFMRERAYGCIDFGVVADRRGTHHQVEGGSHLLDHLHRWADDRCGRWIVENRHA